MVSSPGLNRLTVADAVDAHLARFHRAVVGRTKSKHTEAAYRRDLTAFAELVGQHRLLDDITAADIDKALVAWGESPDTRYKPRPGVTRTKGPASMARMRSSVSRLFKEAAIEGWIETDPMPRVTVNPQVRSMRDAAREALPEQMAAALLEAPWTARPTREGSKQRPQRADQSLALRDEFLLRLFVESGPRVSEVCTANRGDIHQDSNGNWLLTVTGKRNKTRRVPLSPGTKAAYDAYVEDERPDPKPRLAVDPDTGETYEKDPAEDAEVALVLTWRGLRMTPRDMQKMVARYSARIPAEIKRATSRDRVTPHGLRHTAASILLHSGAMDVKQVQELLGHANVATTSIYLETDAAEMAHAVRMHPLTGDLSRRKRS